MSVGSGYVEDKEVQFFSEYLCDIGQSTDNYYLNTKLEAEKLVIEARQSGINTTIFRMGNLVYNSKTGKFQENIEDNAFYKIVRSLVKLGCLPNEDNKYAEFTFIDSASKAIILLFNKNALQNQIFHITNTNIVRYAEFLDLTANTTVKIDIIELNDFLDLLISNYDDPIMKHHVDTVLIHTEMLDDKRYTKFLHGSDRTNLILSMLGFNWDKVTKEHIKKMHEYGAGIGFFEE
jgi:thioester reductase-like protein